MDQLIARLYDYFKRHRVGCYVLLAVLGVGLAFSAAKSLHFDEDISGFLPTNKENARINYAYQHIGAVNKIVLNVTATDTTQTPDPYLLMEAVDSLAEQLAAPAIQSHVKNVTAYVDPARIFEVSSFVITHLPLFLEAEDYVRLDSLVQPEAVASRMAEVKKVLLSPMGMVLKQTLLQDPLLLSGPILSQLQGFSLGNQFSMQDGYIFTQDGNEAIVTLESAYQTSETAGNQVLVAALDQAIAHVENAFDHQVSIQPFGGSYIALTNASQIKKDSIISIIIALVLILALLIAYFKDFRTLVLVLASVLFGGLFALGLLGLVTTSVSLIAVGAASVIVGIAVNYPLHFLSHTNEGYSPRQSLLDTTAPLTTGNITTVGAFLSLLFISSSAMRDLGLFASFLLVGTILFVLVFLPHLAKTKQGTTRGLRFGRLAHSHPEKNGWLVLALVLITVVLSCFHNADLFNADMQSINYMTPVQRQRMKKMLELTQGSQHVMYYVSEGATPEEALQHYEASLPALDTFTRSGIGRLMPSKALQQEKIATWESFWATRRDPLLAAMAAAEKQQGFKAGSFDGFTRWFTASFSPLDPASFGPIMTDLAGNYLSLQPDKSMVYTLLHVSPTTARATEDALNAAASPYSFAFDSGSVTRQMVSALSADFDYVLYVCGFLVLLFLTLSFGRLELSLLSFLPLAVSWIWIMGLMALLGIQFNIVNIILATFIFGMGDDYTIFMTEGMMYEYTYRRPIMGTYKNTVALSSLIMLIGIGSLIVARHPAMRSLGEVTIVGMLSVVVTAYIIPPFCFRLLTVKKGAYRAYPLTFTNFLATAYAFLAFLVGSLYLTLCGFFRLTLGGKTESHKLAYHKRIQSVSQFVVNRIPFVAMHFAAIPKGTFDKPALVIANHQSHLDLMALLSLCPKLIVITNKWVWNSPFYGQIIRYADFCPIDDVLNDDLSKIRERVAQGYSVLVFPEGTRSRDCSLLRFHQGAFYLANQLGIDVVPVLLHGFGHVLPKDDLLLRKGRMDLSFLPRIPLQTLSERTPLENARAARHQYIPAYAQRAAQLETPAYFTDKVLHQYIYKGRSLERATRRALRENAGFAQAIEALPLTGDIELVDAYAGAFAMVAAWVRKDQHVTAHITDANLLEIASHCVDIPKNLTFAS